MVHSLYVFGQQPEALWGKAVQAAKVTGGSDFQLSADGSVYMIGNAATRTEEEFVSFGSDNIAPGSLYRGTNANSSVAMILLSKLTADGQPLWTVYSKDADAMSNSMFVQPVSDGVVAFIGLRHVDKGCTHSPCFIDASGRQVSLDWVQASDADKRYYIAIVMKVSTDGNIQWLRKIDVAHDVSTQSIYVSALAVDAGGCLYLAGQQREAFTLKKSDGTEVTIAPHNTDGWNGSSSAGDLFVIKLDKNGYYLDHLQTVGSATFVTLQQMTLSKGKLYVMGYVVPDGTNHQIALGGKTMMLENEFATPFTACLNTDLTAVWAQTYQSGDKGFTLQTPTLHVSSDALWLAGMGAVSLTTKDGKLMVIGENMSRVATLLKFDAANGDLLDGYLRPLFQTGYFGLMEDTDGYLYAAGFEGVLNSNSNPNKRSETGSLSMDKFNPADLSAPVATWSDMIHVVAGTTGIRCAADGRLFTMTRATSTDNALMGGPKKVEQTSTAFSCNVCSFQLPVRPKPQVIAGDANGDGVVDVSDVVAIVNKILEKPAVSFVFEAADVNGDGVIDVSDVVAVVNIILHAG